MPRKFLPVFLLVCVGSLSLRAQPSTSTEPGLTVFNVRAYGATGDGHTKDTAAFQKALDACANADGGEVHVPAGNYVLGSIVLGKDTTLRLDNGALLRESPDPDDYPLVPTRFEGEIVEGHRALIFADSADNIAIIGPGGFIASSALGALRNPHGPAVIEPVNSHNVTLDSFFIRYDDPAPGQRYDIWCIHLNFCQNITAKNLRLRSQLSNGDGLDVDSCTDVQILQCDIDTGDDAISLKSGRGQQAVKLARPTQNVSIQDCTLGSNAAGIDLGSEMSGGISNITIGNCTFTHGAAALSLKSRTGRGGFMSNLTATNLTTNTTTFLTIDLLDKGLPGAQPLAGNSAYPAVANISIIGASVNCTTLVDATKIPPQRPLAGLTLGNLTGLARRGLSLANITRVNLFNIGVTGFSGELLRSSTNVSGSGLSDPTAPQANSSSAAKP
jgi:polygalacturonase